MKKENGLLFVRKIDNFEEGFPDGVYAVPSKPQEPILNIPAMYGYCKSKGVKPAELSKKEMEQFLEYN